MTDRIVPDGYRAVPYAEFASLGLTKCLTCSALVGNTTTHTAWHAELRDALQALRDGKKGA